MARAKVLGDALLDRRLILPLLLLQLGLVGLAVRFGALATTIAALADGQVRIVTLVGIQRLGG